MNAAKIMTYQRSCNNRFDINHCPPMRSQAFKLSYSDLLQDKLLWRRNEMKLNQKVTLECVARPATKA